MIGRLEEFPSLKNPSIQENNVSRRKKRMLILYSLCLFSIIVVYRLVMTIYWVYTLDLDKLFLNKVVYDTETWKKVEVDLRLGNSYSPVNVKLTDVSMKLSSVYADGSEHFILSLRVPSADFAKNRSIGFNGDIYVDDFDKKNAIDSRFSLKFIVKVDAKLYPRLCFLRFPFHRFSEFYLNNPISEPAKNLVFKNTTIAERGEFLEVKLEIDHTKFSFPKFLAIRSSGITIFPHERTLINTVEVGSIDIDRAEFLKPFKVKFCIPKGGVKAIKKKILGFCRGDETGFVLDSFCVGQKDERAVSETHNLNLKLGFNARNPEDYHLVFGGPGAMQFLGSFSNKPLFKAGCGLRGEASFSLDINKCMIPLMSESSKAVLSLGNDVLLDIFVSGRKACRLWIAVEEDGEYISLKPDLEDICFLDSIRQYNRAKNAACPEIVVSVPGGFGALLGKFVIRLQGHDVVLLSDDEMLTLFSLKERPSDGSFVYMIHKVNSASDCVCINTSVVLNASERCDPLLWDVEFDEQKHALDNLGFDIEVEVFNSVMKSVSGDSQGNNASGALSVRTLVGDLDRMLDFAVKHAAIAYEVKALLSRHFSTGDPGPEERSNGAMQVKYDVDNSGLNEHLFLVSVGSTESVRDAAGLTVVNEISIPNLQLCVGAKHCFGSIPVFDIGRFEDSNNSKSYRGSKPLRISLQKSNTEVIWQSQQLWIKFRRDLELRVSADQVNDLLVLFTRGLYFYPPSDSSDLVSKNVAYVLNRYFDIEKSGVKTLVDKNLVFSFEVDRVDTHGDCRDGEFKLLTMLSCPVEMVESSQVSFDIPETIRIELKTVTESPRLPKKDLFFSMDVSLGAHTRIGDADYKSMKLECIASEFPPEKIDADRITRFVTGQESDKGQNSPGDVYEKVVYIDVYITIGKKQHPPITISMARFKSMMSGIRYEISGGSPTGKTTQKDKSYLQLFQNVVMHPIGGDSLSRCERSGGVGMNKKLLGEMEERHTENLMGSLRMAAVPRIYDELVSELLKDAESSLGKETKTLDLEPLGFTSWDMHNETDRKLKLRYYTGALKSLLFSRVPNMLLRSFYEVIPSGLRIEFRMGDGVTTLHLDSNYKNKWPVRSSGDPTDLGMALGDNKNLKTNRRIGRYYRIMDFIFSEASFSDVVTYDFSSLCIGDGRIRTPRWYDNPFTKSEEYDEWHIPISIGLDVYVWRNGVISVPDMRFGAPFIFIMTSLFPGSTPFHLVYNVTLLPPCLEIALPFPFDMVLPHSDGKPLLCITMKSHGSRSYYSEIMDKDSVETLEVAICPSRRFPNTLVFRVPLAFKKPTTTFSTSEFPESLFFAWPHCDLSVSVSGTTLYNRGGHHVIVDVKELMPRSNRMDT